ncbi:unnamed protein product [Nezara viridula]|uniref:Uncharacterized protein n=1 Tax=Nezara viridula TaxID=85310 RepID=A0A9P0HF34_NEZVI|nr:unnamed protein product [Nezara viridula]
MKLIGHIEIQARHRPAYTREYKQKDESYGRSHPGRNWSCVIPDASAEEQLSSSKPQNIESSPLLHSLQAGKTIKIDDGGLPPVRRQKRTFGKWLSGGYGGGGCGYGCGGGSPGGYVAYPAKVIEFTVVKGGGGGGWGNTGGYYPGGGGGGGCGYGGCGGGSPVYTQYPSGGNGCGPGGCGGGVPSYTHYPSGGGGGSCSTCGGGGGGGSYSHSQASASSSSGSW